MAQTVFYLGVTSALLHKISLHLCDYEFSTSFTLSHDILIIFHFVTLDPFPRCWSCWGVMKTEKVLSCLAR